MEVEGEGRDRDIKPRLANRATKEVRAFEGARSKGALSQIHGNSC